MKKNRKLSKLMLFASTGAFVCTGSGLLANQPGSGAQTQSTQTYQREESVEFRSDGQREEGVEFEWQVVNEPSGTQRSYSSRQTTSPHSFGTLQKADDLIGMEVRNHQGERLGDVKDVMVDLHSGRIPFAVIATEGMNDRLVAVPPSALQSRGQDHLMLNMTRQRLQSAPGFERNRWPDMTDQQWSSDVYRYYGAEPYWQSGSYQQAPASYQRRTEIQESQWTEPAGARSYQQDAYFSGGRPYDAFEDSNTMDDINKGSNTRGGAEDLQRFDEKANRSRGRVASGRWQQRDSYWHEASGANRGTHHQSKQMHRSTTGTSGMSSPGISSMGRLHRASELRGMTLRNAQGETIGKIEDVVLDMNSGHVAYAVVNADRYLNASGEFVAVPPSLFTYGSDGRGVTINANRDLLMNAPRLQRDSWQQAADQRFVSRVYNHYGQQPYWQAQGFQQGEFREPSGAALQQRDSLQDDQSEQQPSSQESFEQEEFQRDDSSSSQEESSIQQPGDVNEPAGAQQENQDIPDQEAQPNIDDPAGAQPESDVREEQQEINDPSGAELNEEQPERAFDEPAGAQPQQQEALSGEQTFESETPGQAAPSAGFESQVNEPTGATVENEAVQQESTQELDDPAGAAAVPARGQQPQLEEQVRTTLMSDPGLQSKEIQVTEENGKIVLRGTVNSEEEKQQIEKKVQQVILDNQIRVEESQDRGAFPSQP